LDPAYKCAAVVVFPKERQLSLMLSSGGAEWALEELEKTKSEGPSKENREIVGFLVQQGKNNMAAVLKVVSSGTMRWCGGASLGSIRGSF